MHSTSGHRDTGIPRQSGLYMVRLSSCIAVSGSCGVSGLASARLCVLRTESKVLSAGRVCKASVKNTLFLFSLYGVHAACVLLPGIDSANARTQLQIRKSKNRTCIDPIADGLRIRAENLTVTSAA